jgi:predicted GNAT superfamily acetyltransferase
VRKAAERDIEEIIDLVEAVHIRNLKNLDGGFLIIPNASRVLYQFWLANSRYCYVAKNNGLVVGVFIALLGGQNGMNGAALTRVCEIADGAEYLTVIQIASRPEQRRRGVGIAMCERFFSDAGARIVFSTSMKKPYNEVSKRFHRKMGFEEIEELSVSDGTEVIIWRWKPKVIEYRSSSGVRGRKE